MPRGRDRGTWSPAAEVRINIWQLRQVVRALQVVRRLQKGST